MKERLAKKAAEKQQGSGKGVVRDPRSVQVVGKTLDWFLWVVTAFMLLTGLVTGGPLPSFVFSLVHMAWFANFSCTDIAFQQRAIYAMVAGVGMLPGLRAVLYTVFLANVAAHLALGYNVLERLLYGLPPNRPENPEPLSVGFVRRLFTEPSPKGRPFALRPAKEGPGAGPGSFEYATSRTERRKGR